jgi:hypothetical protein
VTQQAMSRGLKAKYMKKKKRLKKKKKNIEQFCKIFYARYGKLMSELAIQ